MLAASPIGAAVIEGCLPTSVPMTPLPTASNDITVDVSDLTSANPAKVVTGVTAPDGFKVMVTRVSDTDFRALSMRCTHQNCSVDTRLSGGEIHCSCHGSNFGLDGSVLTPPATVALTSYPVTVDPTSHLLHAKLG